MIFLKKNLLLLVLAIILINCKTPVPIVQQSSNYIIEEWAGGSFYYVNYRWKGGDFNEGIALVKSFLELQKQYPANSQVIARFPEYGLWQIGLLSTEPITISGWQNHHLETMIIPPGQYGAMKARGHVENMFLHYNTLRNWLLTDLYLIKSPVFEIYNETTLNDLIPVEEQIGEIRYKVTKFSLPF